MTPRGSVRLVAEFLPRLIELLGDIGRRRAVTQTTVVNARPGRVKVSVRSYQRSSCIRFSSLSATSSSISFAVARPGVTTVICLIVNDGSSARPSVRNATTPAMEIAMSRNR